MDNENQTEPVAEKNKVTIGSILISLFAFCWFQISYIFRHGVDGGQKDSKDWIIPLALFLYSAISIVIVIARKHKNNKKFIMGLVLLILILFFVIK